MISPPITHQLWMAFPAERRERIIAVLARVVAQQLAKPPEVKEVAHDRS